METIEQLGLTLENLQPGDLGGVMALVSEAGWNQTPADWKLMCNIGDAIVLKDKAAGVVASALALPYGSQFGWISMVLVSNKMRRKGLATFLLENRITWLRDKGLTPILDATEDGEKVYRNIGFKGDLTFTRWQGAGLHPQIKHDQVRRAASTDIDLICQFDAKSFSVDRTDLITDFMQRVNSVTFVNETVQNGFVILRQGSKAAQLGPMIAPSTQDAIALIETALSHCDGPVFFDLRDQHPEIAKHLVGRGFEKQRSFKRMSLGDFPDFARDEHTFIVAGPEYG